MKNCHLILTLIWIITGKLSIGQNLIQSGAGGAELENILGKYRNLSDPATTALQGELICGSSISGVFNSDVNDYKYYAWILNADSVFENGCSITATLKADLNDFKTNISIFTAQGKLVGNYKHIDTIEFPVAKHASDTSIYMELSVNNNMYGNEYTFDLSCHKHCPYINQNGEYIVGPETVPSRRRLQAEEDACTTTQSFFSSPGLPIDPPCFQQDTITVPPQPGYYVEDVILFLDVTHFWIEDLEIDLSQSGITQNVWNQPCGSAVNIFGYFSDSFTDTSCSSVSNPNGGNMSSHFGWNPYSVHMFTDLSNPTNWTMTMDDNFCYGDGGIWNEWGIKIVSKKSATFGNIVSDPSPSETETVNDCITYYSGSNDALGYRSGVELTLSGECMSGVTYTWSSFPNDASIINNNINPIVVRPTEDTIYQVTSIDLSGNIYVSQNFTVLVGDISCELDEENGVTSICCDIPHDKCVPTQSPSMIPSIAPTSSSQIPSIAPTSSSSSSIKGKSSESADASSSRRRLENIDSNDNEYEVELTLKTLSTKVVVLMIGFCVILVAGFWTCYYYKEKKFTNKTTRKYYIASLLK